MKKDTSTALWISFSSGLAGAIIAAAVTYWAAVEKTKNDAVLKNALADAKEQYLSAIRSSITEIAKAEANAENASINSQKFITRLVSVEERANNILTDLESQSSTSRSTSRIKLDEENLKKIEENLKNDITNIQIPVGAVLSFDLVNCPNGWKEYASAYGHFIRGIDKTGRIDPDGIRLPGNIQNDSFEEHTHSRPKGVYDAGGVGNAWVAKDKYYGFGYENAPSTGLAGDVETRPKNVALLYCRKT